MSRVTTSFELPVYSRWRARQLSSLRAGLVAALLVCGSCRSTAPVAPAVPAAPDSDVSEVSARDPGSTLGADWKLGPFAELYVRGYKDSDGDGIGDLRGVTEQLDYLKALGVTGIWLMPVNTSQDRDHGYAVTEYRAIEPQYGTTADFDELVRQAHTRGIGVIMDYVFNHSAATTCGSGSTAGGRLPFRCRREPGGERA